MENESAVRTWPRNVELTPQETSDLAFFLSRRQEDERASDYVQGRAEELYAMLRRAEERARQKSDFPPEADVRLPRHLAWHIKRFLAAQAGEEGITPKERRFRESLWDWLDEATRDAGANHATPERPAPKFRRGDLVRKKGSKGQWHGQICGEYHTEITPEGYAVESSLERGSVQIYPASALEKWDGSLP